MLNARDAQTLETLRARDSEIYHTAWCLVVDSGRGCGVQHPRKGAWCCPSLAGGGHLPEGVWSGMKEPIVMKLL